MDSIVVGMADCQVSSSRDQVLVTYALGSCIAVTIHDPVAGVGGLLHYMLPESAISPAKAGENPYMFADTGIPLLFHRAYECGAQKRRLVVRVAGGAQVMDREGVFNIGKRNYLALRKILWKAGVLLQGEHVGGNLSRTVRLEVGSGRFWLREPGSVEQELPLSSHALKGAQTWPSAS
ncbi:MAG TPA: chemotaxis protein CheD [Bryobacteraceae bacterium]|nr:chemotaxis protein CheD [Bryobacteraceae bacterium]